MNAYHRLPTVDLRRTICLLLRGSLNQTLVASATTTPVMPMARKASLHDWPFSLKTAEMRADIASPMYTPTYSNDSATGTNRSGTMSEMSDTAI